jgi:hypothetical protein
MSEGLYGAITFSSQLYSQLTFWAKILKKANAQEKKRHMVESQR